MGDHFHSKYVKMYGEWGHFLKARMNWVVGLKIFQAFSTRCDQPLNNSFSLPLMSTSFPLFFFLHKALTPLYCYRHIKPMVKGLDQARYWQQTPLQTCTNIVGLCKLYNNVLRSRRLPSHRTKQNSVLEAPNALKTLAIPCKRGQMSPKTLFKYKDAVTMENRRKRTFSPKVILDWPHTVSFPR